MKHAFAWMAGVVGIAALGRWLARRRAATSLPPPRPEPPADELQDPAGELRRKLAEQRGDGPTAHPRDEAETLDERRARVHAKAQEAIEAMRAGDDGS